MKYDLEWRPYPKDKRYWVSENGDVISFCRKKSKTLKNSPSGAGYHSVSVRGKPFFVHRIVAETYIGEIKKGMCVNHKSGIKTENNYKNLEIVTFSENMRHAVATGLKSSGEDMCNASLKNKDIEPIFKMLIKGHTQVDVAKKFKTTEIVIRQIMNGKSWRREGFYEKYVDKIKKKTFLKMDAISLIRKDLAEGLTYGEVAKKYNVSYSTVLRIKKSKTKKYSRQ